MKKKVNYGNEGAVYYIDRHIAIKTHCPAASEPLFSAEQSLNKTTGC